ncbi:MAG: SpoIIE family protein phosphatase [Methanoregula sp.]|jgi:sigma-B regulation protein RsbU (phosphoserine phosphatase)
MDLVPFTRMRLTIRAKILILFFVLSLIALSITGYFAFTAITGMGAFAQESSQSLGQGMVNDSSAALVSIGEDYLKQVSSDLAYLTDVVFEDTNAEIEILAAQTSAIQVNHPLNPVIPVYPGSSPPNDPLKGPVIVFAPGATVTADSEETYALRGMADSIASVYDVDADLKSIYIATDSGIMLIYPGTTDMPAGYDPRTREWYNQAVETRGRVWSDKPYVDAEVNTADSDLVMTCSRAVYSTKYGNWVIGMDVSTATINANVLTGTLDGKGYAVLLNQNGTIISRPGLSAGRTRWDEPFTGEDIFQPKNPGLAAIAANMTAGKTGLEKQSFYGEDHYIAYAPVTSMNWRLAISIPASEITGPVDSFAARQDNATREAGLHITSQTDRLRAVILILFFVILAIVLFAAFILSRVITRPVETLKEGAAAIGDGNLNYRVTLQSGDEFEDLARSFNSMADELKVNIENLRLTTAEKERFTRELEIAKSIQTSFLPEKTPDLLGFEISAVMIPAMEVGGDFYDFIPLSSGRWAFVIADVSGKGVSAALFMALSRTLIRAGLEGARNPGAALATANRLIARDAQSCMFVTAFTAILDPGTGTLSCINAGHNPPLVFHSATGKTGFLKEFGIPFGVMPEIDTQQEIVDLPPGDVIVMYTDGVTEAFNPQYEAFGEDRLNQVVGECNGLSAEKIRDRILAAVRAFTGSAPQSDDITLVVIHAVPK